MQRFVMVVGTLAIALGAGSSMAADIGVAGKKLIVVDKVTAALRAKVVYVSKDAGAGISKGTGTDVSAIDAVFDFTYASGSAGGSFVIPLGASNGVDGWKVNKASVAKYVNKIAPSGPTGVKVAVIKPGKLLKLVGKNLGDAPIDIFSLAPGAGGVDTVYTVNNGADTNRHCGNFPTCSYKLIAAGTGAKLVCKNGVGSACPAATTTTTSTVTTTSTSSTTVTTTSTSSTSTTSTSSTTTTSTSSSTTTTAPPITGPAFPPNGGTVSFAVSGAPSPGAPGGSTIEFTNFVPNTTWTELYWGPDSTALPTAGLDGSPHALTLSGIAGTIATWAGTTSWTNPVDSTVHPSVPIQLRITITGLGGTPWALSTSIAGLDPGPGTGIGAVVDNSASFLDFDANVQFLADVPTDGPGFIALNTVQAGGGLTNSSSTGAFYSAVP
jgi:hypothetical protein